VNTTTLFHHTVWTRLYIFFLPLSYWPPQSAIFIPLPPNSSNNTNIVSHNICNDNTLPQQQQRPVVQQQQYATPQQTLQPNLTPLQQQQQQLSPAMVPAQPSRPPDLALVSTAHVLLLQFSFLCHPLLHRLYHLNCSSHLHPSPLPPQQLLILISPLLHLQYVIHG
jgi:hypothetical protein